VLVLVICFVANDFIQIDSWFKLSNVAAVSSTRHSVSDQ